jgi:type VI secretion system secreted protein Hcp
MPPSNGRPNGVRLIGGSRRDVRRNPMPVYLKYDDITGDVTESAHYGWIELKSFSFGVQRSTTNEIRVTKGSDSASAALQQQALSGSSVDATIDLIRDEGGVSLRIVMSETMISSITVSGSGDTPLESITLNFTKVDLQNNPGTPP